jgi:hypothetical protein
MEQAKLYQDAEILRGLFPKPPSSRAEAEAVLSVLNQRLRIKIHTLIPNGDERGWLAKVIAWDEAQESLFQALAAAMTEPNQDYLARYVVNLNFFSATSPLVVMARSHSEPAHSEPAHSEPAQPTVVLAADTQSISETSLYEQALADCMQVITQVGQFLDGSIDETTLVQKIT